MFANISDMGQEEAFCVRHQKQCPARGCDTLSAICSYKTFSHTNDATSSHIDTITTEGATNSTALGGAGNDLLGFRVVAGGGFADGNTFDGGTGIDTFSFALFSGGQTVDLQSATAASNSGSISNTLLNIENVVAGSGSDTLIGNEANNILANYKASKAK